MRLADLIDAAAAETSAAGVRRRVDIRGLSADSRTVAPGFLFAALPGSRDDGRRFVPDALDRGARAVLAPPGTMLDDDRAVLVTAADPRAALARMAAAFSGAQPRVAAAVTGTNGKTSVAEFARQLWSMLGREAASIGTLGVRGGDGGDGGLTTPDAVALHGALAALARRGVDHVALEASSHGLDQRRLDGVALRAAAFTNLSRDHLDYHGTEDAYLDAKLRLFSEIMPASGAAVVNADSDRFGRVAAAVRGRLLSYGRAGRDLRLEDARTTARGTLLSLRAFGRAADVELPFPDGFQTANALCAAGLVVACGAAPDDVLGRLERLADVPGRVQRVGSHACGAPVFVDYAHTPDGLDSLLKSLRPRAAARLIVVFGCGGERDRGKRPLMGGVAARRADLAIVTDDNPRGEDPAAIRAAIRAAAPAALEIPDRADAIAEGVAMLAPGDVLVIAGKGHETGQVAGGRVRPFDDAEVARDALAASGGRPG